MICRCWSPTLRARVDDGATAQRSERDLEEAEQRRRFAWDHCATAQVILGFRNGVNICQARIELVLQLILGSPSWELPFQMATRFYKFTMGFPWFSWFHIRRIEIIAPKQGPRVRPSNFGGAPLLTPYLDMIILSSSCLCIELYRCTWFFRGFASPLGRSVVNLFRFGQNLMFMGGIPNLLGDQHFPNFPTNNCHLGNPHFQTTPYLAPLSQVGKLMYQARLSH